MKLLLCNEWLRFVRNPVNIWALGLLFLALSVVAILSGMAAAEVREKLSRSYQGWHETRTELLNTENPDDTAVIDVGQRLPALMQLEPLGGLALSVRTFDLLHPEMRSDVRVRHLDGRKTDALYNPLLQSLGALDLAAIVALLVPLDVIALAFGLVHEERERGIWRQLCTLAKRPWHLPAAALIIRFLAVFAAAWTATAIAFAIDPGASFAALFGWTLALAALVLSWTAIAGLFSLFRLSSAGSAAGLIGTWALLTFALPALLSAWADQRHPAPSPLRLIAEVRDIQEDVFQSQEVLISQWYRSNPAYQWTEGGGNPAWLVAMTIRSLAQDAKIRPLATAFDAARGQRFEVLDRRSWIAPGLSVLTLADRLAGANADRYARFIEGANEHEDRWRAYLLPSIMSNARLDGDAFMAIPPPWRYTADSLPAGRLLDPFILPLLLLLLLFRFRGRAARP